VTFFFRAGWRTHLIFSTRQYARIVQGWVASIGLNPATPTKLESRVRYLGVEVDDAIAVSEGVDP
jgi:hypothetical protein